MSKTLIKNLRFIVTNDNDDSILENCDVLFDDLICDISKDIPVLEDYNIIDGKDYIMLPGLFNMHTHLGMSIFRGYNDSNNLHDWLFSIIKIEDQFDVDVLRAGFELSLIELLKKGCVSFLDMYYFPSKCIDLVEKYKIKGFFGPCFSDGKLSDKTKENNLMLKHESNFFKCVPCVHSIYTNSKETIIKTKEITRKNNQYFSIHAAETRKEVYDCYEKHKMYVIEYLDSLGVLDEKTILFHVGYITKDEVLILKKRGCIVVSNPISNMKLATGAQFPYVYLKNNGVNICLGTDGSASNNNLNMFEEMKVFSLLMKHNFWEADIAHPKEVLKIASKNAYDAFSINGGEIKKGNVSDFSLINVNNIDLIPLRKSNLISNLVFSFDGDVDYTFVNGNLSYKKEDLPKLSKRAKELGEIINSFMQKNA